MVVMAAVATAVVVVVMEVVTLVTVTITLAAVAELAMAGDMADVVAEVAVSKIGTMIRQKVPNSVIWRMPGYRSQKSFEVGKKTCRIRLLNLKSAEEKISRMKMTKIFFAMHLIHHLENG